MCRSSLLASKLQSVWTGLRNLSVETLSNPGSELTSQATVSHAASTKMARATVIIDPAFGQLEVNTRGSSSEKAGGRT